MSPALETVFHGPERTLTASDFIGHQDSSPIAISYERPSSDVNSQTSKLGTVVGTKTFDSVLAGLNRGAQLCALLLVKVEKDASWL
jgi:hypothetical protein